MNGLYATYYTDTALTTPNTVRVDSIVDWSRAAGSVYAASQPSSNAYTVRWVGFVKAKYAGTYTFFAKVQETDERVRLWVDNVAMVDQWTVALSSLEPTGTISIPTAEDVYEVRLEYQQTSNNHGVTLSWQCANFPKGALFDTRLFSDTHVMGSPFNLSFAGACRGGREGAGE